MNINDKIPELPHTDWSGCEVLVIIKLPGQNSLTSKFIMDMRDVEKMDSIHMPSAIDLIPNDAQRDNAIRQWDIDRGVAVEIIKGVCSMVTSQLVRALHERKEGKQDGKVK